MLYNNNNVIVNIYIQYNNKNNNNKNNNNKNNNNI